VPDGVEFLDEGGRGPHAGEEVLATGPHHRVPRWLYVLVALVVAALIAGLVTRLDGDSSEPVAAPSSLPSSAARSTASTPGTASTTGTASTPGTAPVPVVGGPGPQESAADVQAAALVGSELVTVQLGVIRRVDLAGFGHVRTVTVGLPVGDPTYADWNLVSSGGRLWLTGGARVYRVDPRTLKLSASTLIPSATTAAAGLDGHLYLSTDIGVYDFGPSASKARHIPDLRGARAMAADPSRHRLLLLDQDFADASIRTYRPGGHGTGGRTRELPLGEPSIAVVAGAIWVAGLSSTGDGRPIVLRLDPRTLVVSRTSPVAGQLGAAPELIAGEHSLFARSGGSGAQLWCLEPHTGKIVQHWADAPGQLVSRDGVAMLIEGDTARSLRLNSRCRG
jgi:hypothetical protein